MASIALARPADAQAVGGRVVDQESGRPLARVAVIVEVPGADSLAEGDTARDGAFIVPLPRAGRYVLRFHVAAGAPVVTDSIDVAPDTVVEREFRVPVPAAPVFLPFQVDRGAALRRDNVPPRYPVALRDRGQGGRVLVEYVVDARGRMRAGSFAALAATDPAFAAAVEACVAVARFDPAERDGQRVAQTVRHRVTFTVLRPGQAWIDIGNPLPVRPGR